MYERVVCISLKRRIDRREAFFSSLPNDWPFGDIEVYDAIDGALCTPPSWWRQSRGAWGCFKSHLNLIEDCINKGVNSVLLLEDDARCCEAFSAECEKFFNNLPQGECVAYLGGQHLLAKRNPPKRVNDFVFKGYNINRTHAWSIRGLSVMREVYKHLNAFKDWKTGHHIDHHLGILAMRQVVPVYCPSRWLMYQDSGVSDVTETEKPVNMWPNADVSPPSSDFVIVVGVHRSGSSCCAGVLHHIGVHMGSKFVGCEPNGGYEAAFIAQACEKAMRFPSTSMKLSINAFKSKVLPWVLQKQREAKALGTIAGCKYPHLCVYGQAFKLMPIKLKVINIERDINASINSIIKRSGQRHSSTQLANLQRMLYDEKTKFLESGVDYITVKYCDLLNDPVHEAERMASFIGVELDEDKRRAVQAWVQPSLQHFF